MNRDQPNSWKNFILGFWKCSWLIAWSIHAESLENSLKFHQPYWLLFQGVILPLNRKITSRSNTQLICHHSLLISCLLPRKYTNSEVMLHSCEYSESQSLNSDVLVKSEDLHKSNWMMPCTCNLQKFTNFTEFHIFRRRQPTSSKYHKLHSHEITN